MILPLNKNLQLQYDHKHPPLLLALEATTKDPEFSSDRSLSDLYDAAEKIHKAIDLRVDCLNEKDVNTLPCSELKKFRHAYKPIICRFLLKQTI